MAHAKRITGTPDEVEVLTSGPETARVQLAASVKAKIAQIESLLSQVQGQVAKLAPGAPVATVSDTVIAGNYNGGQPNYTPKQGVAFAIDNTTGNLWAYFKSSWIFTGITLST